MRWLLKQPFLALWLVAGLVAIAAAIGATWEFEAARTFFREGETVENLTLVGYALAIALLLGWSRAAWRFRLYSAAVLAVLAMRELDLHKAFTSDSFMKLSYYARGEDPILGRIVAGLVMLAILALLVRYLAYGRPLLAALAARRRDAESALSAVLLLPVSKALDSILGLLAKHLGHRPTDNERLWFGLIEETLELAIPLVVVLAVVQFNLLVKPAERRQQA